MSAKRAFDVIVALLALALSAPVLLVAMLLIWTEDGRSPVYRGLRVGRGGADFRMAKLRTMTVDAERRGGPSTSRSDARVTRIGAVLRRCKIDELPQFWNVLTGEMSVVGPRPNVRLGGVDRYTAEELGLLAVRPGITDLASITFADEADILEGALDPDARYDRVIRPWKSRLGLLYVEKRDLEADMRIVWLTALGFIARPWALEGVADLLADWGAPEDLRRISRRRAPLPLLESPGPAE